MEQSRRNFLRALGVGAAGGLAGCIDLPNRNNPGPATVRRFPSGISISDDHAVVIPDNISGVSVEGGEQVRLRRSIESDDEDESQNDDNRPVIPGVFTRIDDPPISPDGNVYMAQPAMDALKIREGDSLFAATPASNTNYNNQEPAREDEELLEQFVEATESDYIVIAPYGGDMQQNTGKQAVRVTSTDVAINAWALFGYDQRQNNNGYHRWRIPAADINPESYERLRKNRSIRYNRYNRDFDGAVSFEGDDDISGVLVNGFAPREFQRLISDKIQEELRDANAGVRVRVADAGSTQTISPDHVANRLTESNRNGVAVYQTQNAREVYWKEIADGTLSAIQEWSENN